MLNRIGAFLIIPVVLAAGVLALQNADRAPRATAATIATNGANERVPAPLAPIGETTLSGEDEALPAGHPAIGSVAEEGRLPPNHPPIGSAASPQGALPSPASGPPALTWKAPAGWQEAPNPNAMRLATYRAPGGVDIAISRAGGSTEANIQRWIAQFDDMGRDTRAEKTVHGLHVVTVDVAGTYGSGGMAMGAPPQSQTGWALVGSIVESRSPSYFFKMTGPAAAVRAARPVFDRFIDSLMPL
jgi:hypothetical protein